MPLQNVPLWQIAPGSLAATIYRPQMPQFAAPTAFRSNAPASSPLPQAPAQSGVGAGIGKAADALGGALEKRAKEQQPTPFQQAQVKADWTGGLYGLQQPAAQPSLWTRWFGGGA